MLLGKLRWGDWQALLRVLDYYLTEGIEDAPVPEAPVGLAALLRRCLCRKPKDRAESMAEVAESVQEIYEGVTGKPYARGKPEPTSTSPDLLNNRAVSLLDLGKIKEAKRLWQQALSLEPHHAKAEYNLRLHLWRSGKITDVILVRWLMELCDTYRRTWLPRYLLSSVLLERGDCRSALEILRKLKEPYAKRHEVLLAFAQAKSREDDTRRLLLDFPGHTEPVRSVFITADGTRALSGSEAGYIKLWDLERCECLTSFQAHVGAVHSLALSADQSLILSGGEDSCVKLHAASTGNCLRILQGHTAAVRAVRLGDENQIAVSGSKDHTIRVWHTQTGECLMVLKDHTAGVNAIDLSESGRYALSGSRDATLKLWDLNTGDCVRTFLGHESRVHSVSLSGDGCYALSGSRDATAKLWDVRSGECLRTFHGHRTEAYSVFLSRDGNYALSASRSGTLKLWDAGTGQCLRSLSGSAPIWLSQSGRFAISGDENGVLKVWVVACDKERLPAPFMMCRDRT
jgi:tetratricopeptide (TPR) repeat protein